MNNYADVLESYIIEDTVACEKISLAGIISKLPWKKNKKSVSKYDNMTDEQIAKRLIEGLRMNKVKPLDDLDANTKAALNLTTKISNELGEKYDIYRFDKSLVLVIKKDSPEKTQFNVWANIPGYRQSTLISTPKNELIQSFIKEDK
jgi:hypothetical protein